MRTGPFSVVVLCTGNICRSPIAERALRERMLESEVWPSDLYAQFAVTSAGTGVNSSLVMPEETIAELARLGLPTETRDPVVLDRAVLDGADLVLGMTRVHRRSAVKMLPRLSTRAFTLLEFSRVMESLVTSPPAGLARAYDGGDAAGFMRAATERASRRRGVVPPPEDPRAHDIEDPYGRDQVTFRRVGERISAAVDTITEGFAALARE